MGITISGDPKRPFKHMKIEPVNNSNDFPKLHIRLYKSDNYYIVNLISSGQCIERETDLNANDLTVINDDFREKLECISQYYDGENECSREEIQEILRKLAQCGKYAYDKIFVDEDIRHALREILQTDKSDIIEVSSKDFVMPWELLYPYNIDENISLNKFWGMNFIIYRIMIGRRFPSQFLPLIIDYGDRPTFGVLASDDLENVKEHESPFFMELQSNGKIILKKLCNIDPNERSAGIRELQSFLENNLDIVHFACHAECEHTAPINSSIIVSDNFKVQLIEFETQEIKIKGNPVVVFNACECANMSPRFSDYITSTFLKRGVRGVIATECAIPDRFAAKFAMEFYQTFLSGTPLGKSLFKTRRHFLEKYGNPSGLIYSLYAPPMIRLEKE